MKNRSKKIFFSVLFVAGIVYFPNRASAVCVSYRTAAEAVYTESYNRIATDSVAGSPLEAETIDGVDPSTGNLTLLRDDLSLEGMAGMDFNLTRYYDSKKARIGKAVAEEKKNFAMDTVRISFTAGSGKKQEIVVNTAIYNKHKDALKDMFVSYKEAGEGKYTTEEVTEQTKLVSGSNYNVYGISTGWAFDFPWIETMTLGSDPAEIPVYLHCGSLGTMRIATDGSHRITGFQNYGYQDIRLEDFNQTVEGVACRYLLRDKTGCRTYFNKDGVVVMQKDNHDNTIRFTYRNGIYFDTITDTVGREVKFQYKESAHGILLLQKVTVQGQKVAGGVSKKTITYQSSETSYQSVRGGKLYGAKLSSVTADGIKETYTYDTVESLVNTAGAGVASQRAVTNEAYLLTRAQMDGCIQKYEYRAGAIRAPKAGSSQTRDVVTQHYYVTREYEQAVGNTKKKANGRKYDYFQKQTDSKGNSKLVSYDDLDDEKHEMQAYGTDRLQCVTLVSSYNPNKKQKKKKFTDYVFDKKDIDTATLELKKKPKKSTSVYRYNANRLLVSETAEGKKKTQKEYTYDQGGQGSLIVQETEKKYGTKRTGKASVSINGYTYDTFRNEKTQKEPKAYRAKYKGREYLFTTTYTYHGTGYPAEDRPYDLTQKKRVESYADQDTKYVEETILAENQIDGIRFDTYISQNGAELRLIGRSESVYDAKGNEIENRVYPDCGAGNMGNVIKRSYLYNSLGQQTKVQVNKTSVKHPEQNVSYVEEEITYDSFGNEISVKDQKGVIAAHTYDQETGEEKSSTNAKGTFYETTDETVYSEDNLKTMDLDYYNRCSVSLKDMQGNIIIRKDEKAGTWTESDYDHGEQFFDEEDEEDIDEPVIESRLKEQRTYAFNPTEEKVTVKSDGTKEYNFDIGGRGKEILSGSRYIYNDDNEEIVTIEFSGGAMDAAHCSGWTMIKNDEEIDEEGNSIVTVSAKELNPQYYSENTNKENYYNQYDNYVLSEYITKTVTDEDGNVISEISTTIKGNARQVTESQSVYDDFGRCTTRTDTNYILEDGKSRNQSQTVVSYEYDYQGNITKLTVKSRKDKNQEWETITTKALYNDQGRLVESYDARGTKEGYATKYEYDLSGQLIKEIIPTEKKGTKIMYQVHTKEYDENGNMTVEEIEQADGQLQRKEYTYDLLDRLSLVKDVESDSHAIYAQYLYDREGNKIRQYTGLTKPLTLKLAEGKGDNSYIYMGHNYHVVMSGQSKKDMISETKYAYNKKDEFIYCIDPEGNKESYTYDAYGNLIKTIDRNGNVIKQMYDYQNRLTEKEATETETGKITTHTYAYDDYGNTSQIDDRKFTYDRFHGQVAEETAKVGKKTVKKSYQYDSDGMATSFCVKVGDEGVLSYQYNYDGASRLQNVVQTDHGKKETIASYEYDVNGMLIKESGQKVETSYRYNPDSTLSQLTNKTKEGVLLSQYDTVYNKSGQKTKETEQIRGMDGTKEKRTSNYQYDSLGRLVKEHHTGKGDVYYTYDAHNNRKECKTDCQTISYLYNKNDELYRVNTLNNKMEKVSVTLYRYDKNGNQLATVKRKDIEKAKEGPQFDLNVTLGRNCLNDNVVNHYNAFNQQQEILTKNYKINYAYNDEGLRTSKTVNGKKSVYLWDGDQLVMELSKNGKVKKRYVRGLNLLYMDEGSGTVRQYYVKDSHGSVVQLLNEDGSIAKRYTYDAFGNEEKPNKKDENAFRFCGEYYDLETGSLYLRARSYDSSVGRFISRDTYTGEENEISTLNLYTYCENDGVNAVDPTGFAKVTPGPLPTPRPEPKATPAPTPCPGPPPDYKNKKKSSLKWAKASGAQIAAELYMKSIRFKSPTRTEIVLAQLNLRKNLKLEKDGDSGYSLGKYIYRQDTLEKMKFGNVNMKFAGCELIAVYNAIKDVNGSATKLSKIIYSAEMLGYTVASGLFGTNPYRVGKLLTQFGLKYSVVRRPQKLERKRGNRYIISNWNTNSLFGKLHTYMMKVMPGKKINSYNEYDLDKVNEHPEGFKKMLEGKPFIIGYKVKG